MPLTAFSAIRRRVRATVVSGGAAALVLSLLGGCSPGGPPPGSRWQPANDGAVLLPLPAQDGIGTLDGLRQRLADAPQDAGLAATFARAALAGYAGNGDPRLLGYAVGALAPWQDEARPPQDIWLLRARLQQTRHRFAAAAQDADALLRVHPGEAQALLLAADAWRRAGHLDRARSRCLALGLSGRTALAELCAADLLLTAGDAQAGLEAAQRALEQAGRTLGADTNAWGRAILAEAAAAACAFDTAHRAWRAALESAPRPILALQLGYVDFLLDADEPDRALEQTLTLPPADGVLLRQAISARRTGDRRFAAWRDELAARFADTAGTEFGSLHLRERALYALHVLDDPATAYALAKRNWTLQQGHEDAELLRKTKAAIGAASSAALQRTCL